jgi:hypothetical protein
MKNIHGIGKDYHYALQPIIEWSSTKFLSTIFGWILSRWELKTGREEASLPPLPGRLWEGKM